MIFNIEKMATLLAQFRQPFIYVRLDPETRARLLKLRRAFHQQAK
jgi:hypothetical protein